VRTHTHPFKKNIYKIHKQTNKSLSEIHSLHFLALPTTEDETIQNTIKDKNQATELGEAGKKRFGEEKWKESQSWILMRGEKQKCREAQEVISDLEE